MDRIERIGSYVYQYRDAAPLAPRRRCKVVVIGGGPVGLACALGLARHGIASIVVEADDSVCVGSRAACISRRSLEILSRLGGLPEMLERGLPWSGGRTFWRDREVFRFTMPEYEGQRLPPMINLQQYYVEDALLAEVEAINRSGGGPIEILWATRADAIESTAEGVRLGLHNSHGRGELEADWALACDGGQSFVRTALALELKGAAYTGRYAIVDIELRSDHPCERRAWFDPPWYPGGTVLMHRQPDDLWRVDWQLHADDDGEQVLAPENVRRFVQRHLDAIGEGHLPWKAVWSSLYRAGAMTLEHYRHGRVLFAGNAAHAMPIFGVRGLNSGFDDADNLVWKLAAVVRGRANEALLDSYSAERVLAFGVNAGHARRSTEFMSPPSRGFDLLREAALSLADRDGRIAELANPRQTQPIAYRGSALCQPDAPADEWRGGPAPGDALLEVPVEGRFSHLTQVVTTNFTLLHFGPPEVAIAQADLRVVPVLRAQDPRWPDAVIDRQGILAAAYDVPLGGAYLIRPDGHVAARWKSCSPTEVGAAHRRALGDCEDPGSPIPLPDASTARERLYTGLAHGITRAEASREALFLARLALLLFERLGDEAEATSAIRAALEDLPEPSLSRRAHVPAASTAGSR